MFLDFIPFGYYYGDTTVGFWQDSASCFSVSNDFPMFTKKNHKLICVSCIFNKNDKIIMIFVHGLQKLLGMYLKRSQLFSFLIYVSMFNIYLL